MRQFFLFVMIIWVGVGCSPQPKEVNTFLPDQYPEKLSDWGVLLHAHQRLSPNQQVEVYQLNSTLFTDYAHKLRTIWLPEQSQMGYQVDEAFDFPVGAVISKTFYYPKHKEYTKENWVFQKTFDEQADFSSHGFSLDLNQVHLVETRLLVKQQHGWDVIAYHWQKNQQDAYREIAGDSFQATLIDMNGKKESFVYVAPDQNQCAGCHAPNHSSKKIQPIGPKARHLNTLVHRAMGEENQLMRWQRMGLLKNLPLMEYIPKNADETRPNEFKLSHRARSYLDINCGHCHNPDGPADTSGLFLDNQPYPLLQIGFCKPPIAAGKGSGGHRFDIVPGNAQESILVYRMATTDPGEMMPELGRSLVHQEGLALVTEWINQLEGRCD